MFRDIWTGRVFLDVVSLLGAISPSLGSLHAFQCLFVIFPNSDSLGLLPLKSKGGRAPLDLRLPAWGVSRCLGGVSVVSWWCLSDLVVSRECRESRWHLGDASVVSQDDYDKVCWQQLVGKNRLQVLSGIAGVCPADVLVVSQLCFGGRWCLGGTLVVGP